MQMAVTNGSSTLKLNTPQLQTSMPSSVTGSTAGVRGVGGQLDRPLPYPFDRVGEVAASATVTRPIHIGDFDKRHPGAGQSPRQQWQQLVQSGAVTVAFTAVTSTERELGDIAHHTI